MRGIKIPLLVYRAKKHKIKSLYYFCDEQSKEMTAVQKGLLGAQYAKSKVVHSFS